jgi:hypothetical protein
MDYSPGLAIATALFEIAVAVWALRGPGDRSIIRTTAGILVLLATYQVLEVSICANLAAAGFLPRLAFIAVTWLPPLGLLLIAKLHRPRSRMAYGNAYSMLAAALGIVVWIALDRGFVSASVCSALFARYTNPMPRFVLYSGFYWLGLLGMIVHSGYGVKTCPDPHRRRLLFQVFAGTVAFVLPALVVSRYMAPAEGALPSVMCHFALILALFLTRLIYLERKPAEEEQTPAIAHTG